MSARSRSLGIAVHGDAKASPAPIIRRLEMVEPTVIGELLQPGGLRALERMGIAHAATDSAVDSVEVEG